MVMILIATFALTPCDLAAPIDKGHTAPCSGILVSSETARDALKNREELKVRRAFVCPECPDCPECIQKPQKNVYAWTLGGILVGAVMSAGAILLALSSI
tara:strand:+ start:462 stop:761 length:300 start_codon:yes stop_codon:yes gene_type:complete